MASKKKKQFGQVASLTTTLKNILQDYQPSQLLSEQLQNADDAGSTIFAVNLDTNSYSRERLASPLLADWQGPALCCFDDAEFRAEDLEAICRIGEGSKQREPTKTGQFGLGFNSCFHITDLPLFFTGNILAIFDPHASHGLDGCGALFESDDSSIADHMSSFAGCFPQYFDGNRWVTSTGTGTIFRLPLRPKKNGSLLRPTNGQLSIEECWSDVVEPFLALLPTNLLFLNCVQCVRVYKAGNLVKEVHSTLLSHTLPKSPRALLFAAIEDHWKAGKLYKKPLSITSANASYELALSTNDTTSKSSSRWLVTMALATQTADLTFCDKVLKHHGRALLPYAAVALPLDTEIVGRLYVTLPTPLLNGLPLHVDARYELSRDRTALRVMTAAKGKHRPEKLEHARAHWNGCLVPELIATAYVDALVRAGPPANARLPATIPASDHFARPIVDSLYRRLVALNPKILTTVNNDVTTPSEAFYIRHSSKEGTKESMQRTATCARTLAAVGCPVVCLEAPEGFLTSLKDRLFSPDAAARWLRQSRVHIPEASASSVLAYLLQDIKEDDKLVGVHTILRQDHQVVAIDNEPLYLDDELRTGATLLCDRPDLFVSDECAKLILNSSITRIPRFFLPHHAVPLLLPAHWRGRRTMSRNSEQTLILRELWRALAALSRKDRQCALAELGDWPLIPCAGDEVASLDVTVLLPNLTKKKNVSMTTVDDLAMAALATLGVIIADTGALDSFDIVPTTSLTAGGIVEALHRLKDTADWSAIGSEARDALLSVIGHDSQDLDEARADCLAQCPFFPLFYDPSKRVALSISKEERFQVPTEGLLHSFDSHDASVYENLLNKPKNQFHSMVYSRLNIRELPLAIFWRSHLDEERWRRLGIESRIEALLALRRDFEVVRDETLTATTQRFAEWFMQTPLLWCDDNPCELFPLMAALDPQERIHVSFFPRRLPPAELSTPDWLPFLIRAGLRLKVTPERILEAATLVDRVVKLTADDMERARLVVEALFSATSTTLMPVLDEAWLEKISKLRIAQARYGSKFKLYPFAGNIIPTVGALREHYSSYSRRTVLLLPSSTPRVTVIRALGAFLTAPFEDVAHHLVFLARHHSFSHTSANGESAESSEHGLSLVQQLGCCYDSLGYDLIHESENTKKDRVQQILKDVPVIALRPKRSQALQLVKPSQVFLKLPDNEDASPFAYAVDRMCDDFVAASARTPVARYLGCSDRPSLTQISTWLQSIASPVTDIRLIDAAVALARIAYKFSGDQLKETTLLIPDEHRILRPATSAVLFDVPWLSERLDRSKLPIVSPKLDTDIAKYLGAKPLSRVLVERSVGQYTPAETGASSGEIARWQHNLRSPAFAAALRRVSSTQQQSDQHGLHSRRLVGLRKAVIRPAKVLRSRFFLADLDVTKNEAGNQAIIVDEKAVPIVYILVTSASHSEQHWQRRSKAAIGIALDRYLGPNVIRDRAIVGELLSVSDVVEMSAILDMYEVPSFELDLRLGSVWLPDEDGDFLEPLADQSQAPAVGDLVIINNQMETTPIYGRVLSIIENGTRWLVAIAPDLGEVYEIRALDEFLLQRHKLASATTSAQNRYRGAYGWEQTEATAREAIVQRQRNAQVEKEPEGVDDILVLDSIIANTSKLEKPIKKVVRRLRVSPGFDLVRVGNFPRRGADGPREIAYFHHRATVHEVYEDPFRQRLVKECCAVLDDVCSVFGYDTALVALFYQPNSVSRFVRQKILFNIYPVEQFKLRNDNIDIRRKAWPYCYFFGLCVHKLAHFFDVVHGTRHEFFMNEYRVNYCLRFIQLLISRGFDPELVEKEHGNLIHNEVF